MTVFQFCSATRTPGPISFGDRTICFLVDNVSRRFVVHEDLICHTSQYFKSRHQRHRKPLAEDCPVCCDDLDTVVQDVTFCQECGQNIHRRCMQQWERSTPQADGQPGSTCPLCRANWVHNRERTIIVLRQGLESWAVQTYLEWLYTRNIRISDAFERETDAFNLALLKCWKVGTALVDTAFRDAIIAAFFAEARAHFWSQSIEWAFGEQEENVEEMRKFILEVFMTSMEAGWFEAQSDKWPKAFVKALADKSWERALTARKTLEELEAEYIGSNEENSAPTKDVEQTVRGYADEDDEEPDNSVHGKSTSRKRYSDEQPRRQNKRPRSSQGTGLRTTRADREAYEDYPLQRKKACVVRSTMVPGLDLDQQYLNRLAVLMRS